TTGDRFRLADTNLVCEVERDLTVPGEEAVFGGGKSIRDGMAQASGATRAGGALDLVITSVVVLDPVLGVVKADIGVRDGRNAGRPDPLREQVEAGACALKDHEDWGTTPAVIDCSLTVADEYDVQVAIHTDTLNEAGFVEDTVAAIAGRTIHTFHTEGAGGGH